MLLKFTYYIQSGALSFTTEIPATLLGKLLWLHEGTVDRRLAKTKAPPPPGLAEM